MRRPARRRVLNRLSVRAEERPRRPILSSVTAGSADRPASGLYLLCERVERIASLPLRCRTDSTDSRARLGSHSQEVFVPRSGWSGGASRRALNLQKTVCSSPRSMSSIPQMLSAAADAQQSARKPAAGQLFASAVTVINDHVRPAPRTRGSQPLRPTSRCTLLRPPPPSLPLIPC